MTADIYAEALCGYLKKQGYDVGVENQGDNAVARIIKEQPDAVILDGSLPGKDRFTICHEVRPSYLKPILMVTARDEEVDQILGLEFGADAYLTKPVEIRVVASQLKACLRRDTAPEAD